jgi:hypothetical protein
MNCVSALLNTTNLLLISVMRRRLVTSPVFSVDSTQHFKRTCSSVIFDIQCMALKTAVFWDVRPCGSCKNGRFGGTYRVHHQSDKNR